MKYFAGVLTAIGSVAATMGSQACMFWFFDEPKMPKNLIK